MKQIVTYTFLLLSCAGLLAAAQETAQPSTAPELATSAQSSPEVTPGTTGQSVGAVLSEAAKTARETGVGVLEGAGDAVGSVQSASTNALDQTRSLWDQVMLPMWQRVAGAIPDLAKALTVLFVFWLVAMFAGATVRRLLTLTRIDDRAAADWGLGEALVREDGTKRSISGIGGTVVRWTVLLFGLVAFFQSIELPMVADPLQNVADRIIGVIPNLLQAVAILLVYWALASVVKVGLRRLLAMVRFDERFAARPGNENAADGEVANGRVSEQIERFGFYVVLLFGLGPFLQSLGQQSLVSPLNGLLGEALAFVPNLVGAAILFFIGRVIALIVREVVTNFLGAAGLDRAARSLGIDKLVEGRKASQILGSLAYFLVLVPVLAASVDALGVTAISEPIQATLASIVAMVPLTIVAVFLSVIGFAIARALGGLVETLVGSFGADSIPERLQLSFLQPGEGQRTISEYFGLAASFVLLVFVAQQVLVTLGLTAFAELVSSFVAYLPYLASGMLILLVAFSLSRYLGQLIESALAGRPDARLLSLIGRGVILLIGVGIGLSQLGVGENIVAIATAAVLGGMGLGLGIALGFGAKDKAKELVERIVG